MMLSEHEYQDRGKLTKCLNEISSKFESVSKSKGLFTPSDSVSRSDSDSGIAGVPLGRVLLIYTCIFHTRA